MATFTKNILSGSTNGRSVLIAATSGTGTTIHTGPTNTAHLHEIWLYAVNADTTARKLTVQWGGTTSPNDEIELTIPAESGLVLVAPGLLIKGASTALVVRAFASAASVVAIHGYVHEIA